ncbi:MAG: transcription termination factor NusA [Candidatus Paceibacterota bacterium]
MFDLKVIGSVLDQLEEERGVPKEKVIEAIEMALATAYKKEYGKKGQIINSTFNPQTGDAEFFQVKIVVDDDHVVYRGEDGTLSEEDKQRVDESENDEVVIFNPEQHILLSDAKKMKKEVAAGEEMSFPLEEKGDYGRIASQTAKQVIIQKIREAEKSSVLEEYAGHTNEVVSGTVQRVERGNIFIELGRATGLLPREEQIPGERFRQGERVRAYLLSVEESSRGVFVKLSRSHPKFLEKLFESEAPELANGTIVVKGIAREPGSRTKIAVMSTDDYIDPVGSLVGQRGVRVSTVMSELGGEKIDIIEWSEEPAQFIEDALSPAEVIEVVVNEEEHQASVDVAEDQQSLAIGKAGQNVRLAARLTGYKIDIRSTEGEEIAAANANKVEIHDESVEPTEDTPTAQEAKEATVDSEPVQEKSESETTTSPSSEDDSEPQTEGVESQEKPSEEGEEVAEGPEDEKEVTETTDDEVKNS